MRKLALLLGPLMMTVLVIAGCGGGSGGGGNGTTANATVSPTIEVSSPILTLPPGPTQQFTATLISPDGTKQDVTASAAWTSSAPAIASVGTKGAVTANALGSASITASSGGVSGFVTVTVATLSSIAVTTDQSLPVNVQQQFTATGTFANGATADLTTLADWLSSDITVARVSSAAGSKGMVTSVAPGAAVITATLAGVSGNGGVTVTSAALTALAIKTSTGNSLTSFTLAKNTARDIKAVGTYSDNSTHNVTTTATWTATPAGVVRLALDGEAMGVAAASTGTATVTAAFGGQTASATVTATDASLTQLVIEPAAPAIGLNIEPVQFNAIGTFSDGSTQDLTDQVSWTSTSQNIATIGNSVNPGLAQGVAVGTTKIAATFSTVTAPQASLQVTASPPTVNESTPTSGPIGQRVAVKGTNFVKGGTTVTIGGITATTVSVASSSFLEVVVPDTLTGSNNQIVVSTKFPPAATSPQTFTVTTPTAGPTISGIRSPDPALGPAGQLVVLTGTNFIRGTTTVALTSATLGTHDVGAVTVTGTETLTFTVPGGAPNGLYSISVSTGTGTPALLANAFTVGVPTGAPTVTGMTPNFGPPGAYIIIFGTNFVFNQTTVTIGGKQTTPFEFVGPTKFSILVPDGASLIGTTITVQTPNGTAQSLDNFTVTTH